MSYSMINGMRSTRYPLQGCGACGGLGQVSPADTAMLTALVRTYKGTVERLRGVQFPDVNPSSFASVLGVLGTAASRAMSVPMQLTAQQARNLIGGSLARVGAAISLASWMHSAGVSSSVWAPVVRAATNVMSLLAMLISALSRVSPSGQSGLGQSEGAIIGGVIGFLSPMPGGTIAGAVIGSFVQHELHALGVLETTMQEAARECREALGEGCGANEILRFHEAKVREDAAPGWFERMTNSALENTIAPVAKGVGSALKIMLIGGAVVAAGYIGWQVWKWRRLKAAVVRNPRRRR